MEAVPFAATKIQPPRWRHARSEDVTAAEVQAFFAPIWAPDQHPLARLN